MNYWFEYPNDKEYVYLTYAIVLLGALVLNLMKVTVTAMLNTISAYWHMIGVGVIVVILLTVPDDHRSFGSIFTDTVNATGLGRRGGHGHSAASSSGTSS